MFRNIVDTLLTVLYCFKQNQILVQVMLSHFFLYLVGFDDDHILTLMCDWVFIILI
jgi:hypothetical protein